MALKLRNPHSILATFHARPEAVCDVRLPAGRLSDAWAEVERLARHHSIPVLEEAATVDRGARQGRKSPIGGRGGIAEANVKERADVSLETLFAAAQVPRSAKERRDSTAKLWLALDQVQDPHNVGAIFRTAAFFGVAGIIVTRDRSAPLNATVYDVASGGMELVPFANPANLSRALDSAKKSGLWVLGASEHAQATVYSVDRDRPWLLVLGNEERGLRRLSADKCDELCRIPSNGGLGSLNVSVAAGVLVALLSHPRESG